VKPCVYKVHPNKLERYSTIDQVACSGLDDFKVCSRFIPPSSFVPVALPIDTTYVEIDSCIIDSNNTYSCLNDPAPVRVYGNERLFPRSYDTAQTSLSVCTVDGTLQYSNYSTSSFMSCLIYIYRSLIGSPVRPPLIFPIVLFVQRAAISFPLSQRTAWAPSAICNFSRPFALPKPSSRRWARVSTT
jgi:hypothetical protein